MGQESPPSMGEPEDNEPSGEGRGSRLRGWQTLLAAIVTAVAALIGILIMRGSQTGPQPPPKTTSSEPGATIRQEAYITKAWSGPHPRLPSPAVMYHLEGRFKNLEPGTAVVGRLGPETAPDNTQQWVMANAVLDRARSTWRVDLRLQRPGKKIFYQVGTASEDLYEGCPAETACLVDEPDIRPTDSGEPDGGAHATPTEPSSGTGKPDASLDGFTPTTPLTDAKTGQKYSSPPPGVGP
ncbi:hypothetical protein ACIRSU_11140 [Streptomyces sp. NPDC101160]|uniref:hypothetical protein n=1 Tax=Streptomyces sp. NPDC101160 TaxID=3366118 RepID=UPI00382A31A0